MIFKNVFVHINIYVSLPISSPGLFKVKLFIVQAQPGAKGDFLAGWMGTLPAFLDNDWHIDCETGQSFTKAKFLKDFTPHEDQDCDLGEFVRGFNFELSTNAEWNAAGTTHLKYISKFCQAYQDTIKLISVRVGGKDLAEVFWNAMVKNCFTKHRYEHALGNKITWGVDHFIRNRNLLDDEKRSMVAEKFVTNDRLNVRPVDPGAHVVFDYDELFVPGGSQLVTQRLGLQCTDRHHALWDKNLEFSRAPEEIHRFGKYWTFEEFKHKMQNRMVLPL